MDVKPAPDLTADYPQRTAARVHVVTQDGREFSREQSDYKGSPTNPLSWEHVVQKFRWLAEPFCDKAQRVDIIAAVTRLDEIAVAELTGLLGAVSPNAQRPRTKYRS